MPVLTLCFNIKWVRADFEDANEDHILDYIFENTPTEVQVQLWPILPSTTITSATVTINNTLVVTSTLTDLTPPRPPGKMLKFNLGGHDPTKELPGRINTVKLEIADSHGAVEIKYYRRPDSGTTTTTAMPTTTPLPMTTPPPVRQKS